MVRGIYIEKFVYTPEDKQFIKDAKAGRHEYREGLPSVGRRLSAEMEPFHVLDTAVAAHPDWFQYRFPNGEWVFGHGVDSHGFHTGGGTLVVKDSRGLTHVFFGHVCGQNMGFPWGLDSCKGLQDFYKRLSEMSYLEWFPCHISDILNSMILLIDNYDSFTYNLVQRFGEIDPRLPMEVHRNDRLSLAQIRAMAPTHIVISPGPCTPKEAGISNDVLKEFAPTIPIFGVCLGHQCIGYTFGGEVIRNSRIMHGKVSPIHHDGRGVFAGLSDPFDATRYHSLVIKKESWTNTDFEVTAWTAEGEIMGVRHKAWPLHGVQFHPESFLTVEGPKLLKNFLDLAPTGGRQGTARESSG